MSAAGRSTAEPQRRPESIKMLIQKRIDNPGG